MSDGRKFDEGKPRMDLIPAEALWAAGKILEFGARKYEPDNWQNVSDPVARYTASAQRHLALAAAGERLDPESGLSHVDHAMTCIMFLSWFDKRGGGGMLGALDVQELPLAPMVGSDAPWSVPDSTGDPDPITPVMCCVHDWEPRDGERRQCRFCMLLQQGVRKQAGDLLTWEDV